MGGLHAGWALFLCRPASAPASPVQTDASAGNTDAACAFCTTPFVCTSFRKLMSAYHYPSILATRSAVSVHARVHRLPLTLTFTVIDTISNSATVPPLLRRGQNRCGPHKKTRKEFSRIPRRRDLFCRSSRVRVFYAREHCMYLSTEQATSTYIPRQVSVETRTYVHTYVRILETSNTRRKNNLGLDFCYAVERHDNLM